MISNEKAIKAPGRSISIGIPGPVIFSLLLYIGTLAATQTVYGGKFMSIRWVALGAFTLVSFIYWLFSRIPRKGRTGYHGDAAIVFIYLGATLLSVAIGENYQFSGLKWLTQGMLILSCMVFLRGSLKPERIGELLLPLKIVCFVLLLVSIWFPAPLNLYENPYFRGAMSDSNSLGHVAAICALVYLQGAITGRNNNWRIFQLAVSTLAIVILIRTGARSSMAAFIVGLVLMNFCFSLTRSILAKAALFLFAALILASPMLQSKAMQFIAKEDRKKIEPSLNSSIERYIQGGLGPDSLLSTRERLWSEAWEGFKRRPFLGWGFGANADISKKWSIGPASFGMIRDVTNDLLFTLEGSGLVGFLAYLGLMFSILRLFPTRQQLILLRKRFVIEAPQVPLPVAAYDSISKRKTPFRPGAEHTHTHQGQIFSGALALSKANVHSQMYILSVSLFVLFFFDGSAFSAGSLISAIFWISAGMANLGRKEVSVSEGINHQLKKGFKGSRNHGID
jgi:O-antigen ligase